MQWGTQPHHHKKDSKQANIGNKQLHLQTENISFSFNYFYYYFLKRASEGRERERERTFHFLSDWMGVITAAGETCTKKLIKD